MTASDTARFPVASAPVSFPDDRAESTSMVSHRPGARRKLAKHGNDTLRLNIFYYDERRDPADLQSGQL